MRRGNGKWIGNERRWKPLRRRCGEVSMPAGAMWPGNGFGTPHRRAPPGCDHGWGTNSSCAPTRFRSGPGSCRTKPEHLKELPHLESLELMLNFVTDADLADLRGLRQLKHLDLSGAEVTDAGLEHLKGLRQLKTLILRICFNVTDAGLEQLKGLTALEALDLNGTDVTDDGLEGLPGLTNLTRLDLGETYVTYEGIKRLQQALPNCKVIVDDELGLSPFRRKR